jgi:hypothetical protein
MWKVTIVCEVLLIIGTSRSLDKYQNDTPAEEKKVSQTQKSRVRTDKEEEEERERERKKTEPCNAPAHVS